MEKLKALNFTNANNAAMSLHTLAEWVRTGEIKIGGDLEKEPAHLLLAFREPGKS